MSPNTGFVLPSDLFSTDHDLLIRIDTKLDYFKRDMDALKATVRDEVQGLTERVTALEHTASRQSGFFAGSKAIWALLSQLPAGAVALLWGYQAKG